MESADKLQLLVGGKFHEDWECCTVDSSLTIPSDAWSVSLGLEGRKVPTEVMAGAPVEVRIGGDTVMVGRIDDVEIRVSKHEHSLNLYGRDGAAVLVDCSAPVFNRRLVGMDELTAALGHDFGITKIRIDADKTNIREKIQVNPGATAWDELSRLAEANGLWPWFQPDGTLVVGGPDYTAAVVAGLVMRFDGKGNNILSMVGSNSMSERYSDFTVLSDAHGTAHEQGRNDISAHVIDPEVASIVYRPKIVYESDLDNNGLALRYARKLLADTIVRGVTLRATVKGVRIVAPGMPGHGKLWEPSQRIGVESEPHDIADIYFLVSRKFSGSRREGFVTELTLKRDKVWLPDAHIQKRLHRRVLTGASHK